MTTFQITIIVYFLLGLIPVIKSIKQQIYFKDEFIDHYWSVIFTIWLSLLFWPFVFGKAICNSIKSLFSHDKNR